MTKQIKSLPVTNAIGKTGSVVFMSDSFSSDFPGAHAIKDIFKRIGFGITDADNQLPVIIFMSS